MIHQIVFGDVVEEFAFDVKRPTGQRDFDLAMLADVLDTIGEQAGDMRRIGRGGDGDAALASGISEAAANIAASPRLWPIRIAGAFAGFAQMLGGPHQIGDVGGGSSWPNRLRWNQFR